MSVFGSVGVSGREGVGVSISVCVRVFMSAYIFVCNGVTRYTFNEVPRLDLSPF